MIVAVELFQNSLSWTLPKQCSSGVLQLVWATVRDCKSMISPNV